MQQFVSVIKSNVLIASNFYKIDFSWPVKEDPMPGQFFTLRLSETTAPLLRRPFAFSGFDASLQEASMIYQVRGTSTKLLSERRAGEELDIIGPLGNSFEYANKKSTCLMVSGGIGIGPMLFTGSYFQSNGHEVRFIFGCQNKKYIPRKEIFKNVTPIFCTDDGSKGYKGTTVDYLNTVSKEVLNKSTIFACGPLPMLKGCHDIAMKNNTPCQVSMEQIMACGVGACVGCAIKTTSEPGYSLVCKDGPVFNSRLIQWI